MKYIVMVIEDLGEITMFNFPTLDTAYSFAHHVSGMRGKETKLYEVTYSSSDGYIKRLIEIGGFPVIGKVVGLRNQPGCKSPEVYSVQPYEPLKLK